ncbi:MAG: hypothetical protein V4646_04255 [Pseudomonadota bacterium]
MQVRPYRQYPVRLGAGQSLFLQAKAGSVLAGTSGRLVLSGAPIWLGEQVFRSRLQLEPGQAHVIAQDGWITLTASPHGEAVCQVILQDSPALVHTLHRLGEAAGKLLGRLPGIKRLTGVGSLSS